MEVFLIIWGVCGALSATLLVLEWHWLLRGEFVVLLPLHLIAGPVGLVFEIYCSWKTKDTIYKLFKRKSR